MIDQTTLGHTFLKKELGVVPKVGWQLDPFGHSSTQGSLLTSGVGFDALYFGRIHYVDLQHRKMNAECEGLWSSSSSSTTDADDSSAAFWGLTGSYSGNYGGPSGFCFDVKCDEWGEHNSMVGLPEDVLLKRVQNFTHLLAIQANETKGRNIMLTMGMDFFYSQADQNFKNMDILLDATKRLLSDGSINMANVFGNRFDKIDIRYSNPERYTQCKYADAVNANEGTLGSTTASAVPTKYDPASWTANTKRGDFFPYADCDHCYWSGYFSSRQGLKKMERVGSSFLHAARQIESMARLQSLQTNGINGNRKALHVAGIDRNPWTSSPLYTLDDAMGIAQHHDAVTGTSKQHVAYDYAKRIAKGMSDSGSFVTNALRTLLFGPQSDHLLNLSHCHLLNETICDISQAASKEKDEVIYVVVYNALAKIRDELIPLPVDSKSKYIVEQLEASEWEEVNSNLIPNSNYVKVDGAAQFTLYFKASSIPPLGASIFRISQSVKETPSQPDEDLAEMKIMVGEEVSNGVLRVGFDISTGIINSIQREDGGPSVSIKQEYGFYTPFAHDDASQSLRHNNRLFRSIAHINNFLTDDGWNAEFIKSHQNGGAYIFRPSTPDQTLQVLPPKVSSSSANVYKSDLVTEIHAEFGDWIKQITRIIDGKDYVEVEYVVGPVPSDIGKEIISKYSTAIENDGVFYTDANGREFMKRTRSDSSVFGYDVGSDYDPFIEPIAGNYYPVNTAMFIEDPSQSFSILTDRSQSGSSLSDGAVELMIQRRILHDDARGVGEALNETDVGITPNPPYGDATRIGNGVIIKGTHRLTIGTNGAGQARSQMDEVFSPPQIFVASAPKNAEVSFHQPGLSMLKNALPDNIMVITYASLDDDKSSFLIRLAHQYGIGEDSVHSLPVANIDLRDLFPNHDIASVTEKTLSANQDQSEWEQRRYNWNGGTRRTGSDDNSKSKLAITLKPLEIRTFVISLSTSSAPSSSSYRYGICMPAFIISALLLVVAFD